MSPNSLPIHSNNDQLLHKRLFNACQVMWPLLFTIWLVGLNTPTHSSQIDVLMQSPGRRAPVVNRLQSYSLLVLDRRYLG